LREVTDLLKEQNKLMSDHNKLIEDSLGEFMRILTLQAAEAKVSNARTAIIGDTLQKMLEGVSGLGEDSKKLLEEMTR